MDDQPLPPSHSGNINANLNLNLNPNLNGNLNGNGDADDGDDLEGDLTTPIDTPPTTPPPPLAAAPLKRSSTSPMPMSSVGAVGAVGVGVGRREKVLDVEYWQKLFDQRDKST
jgi:hypothetical protein